MSEAVDTRIVEAKFDSSQFEQGVDKTVKKLDELKKSLNLEETGKSITQLADKTKDATEKASSSLKQLEDRFTSFTGMLKQKLLSGIVDEIVGAFFKLKNGVEGLIRSLSTGQISVGMSKYEQMLTSVRTIVAAGDDENAAYEAIGTLGSYADQTSYSLDQMTSALSKMRAAGVDLKTGTKAVEGIANACAAAGVNATDASRAFFNLSQAYSSGYLKYTDYRSLELLNMTTEKFKEQMLDAAVAAGTLQKVSDGVYKTINKNDKKVAAGRKVTIKSLSDSLKYNFMNTEAMNKLFGEKFFFDEEQWDKLKQVYGKDGALEKAREEFGEIAVDAYLAAREARSFTDVMNTLKDVISRGWSKSFELVFGKLGDASEFFTSLAESNLAEAIFAIGDFRNAVLQHWSDSGGRDSMLAALKNIDDLLGRIFEKLGLINVDGDPDNFQKNFDNTTRSIGHNLSEMSRDFETFTKNLNTWFTDERIARIQSVFSIVTGVLSTFFRVLGVAFNFATKVFETFEPVLGKIIDNVLKVVEKVNNIFNDKKKGKGVQDGIGTIEVGLNNVVKAIEPLVDPLGKIIDFLGDVAVFLVDIAAGTFVSNLEFLSDTLGFIIELFGGTSAQQDANKGVGVIDGLKNSVTELGNACRDAFTFIKDFFHNLYEDLRLVFGLREPVEGEEGGFFSNLANFFKTNTFLTDVKNWIKNLPGKIIKLGKELWNTIDEFLFGKKVTAVIKKPSGKENTITYRVKTGFSKWLEQAVTDVKNWFTVTLPEKIKELWNTIDEFFFGKKQSYGQMSNQYGANITGGSQDRIKEGFSAWLEQAIADVKDWIVNMPDRITELWNTMIDTIFYRDPQPKEVNPVTGKEYGPNERVKTGFLVWLESIPGKIWGWITVDVPNIIKEIWNTVIGWIFGPTMGELAKVDPTIRKDKDYDPNKRVGTSFSKWLLAIPDNVKSWIENDLSEVLLSIWNKVIGFIFGEEVDPDAIDPNTGEAYGPNVRVKEGFSKWLDETITSVQEWTKSVPDKIKSIWDTVLKAIFGNSEEETAEVSGPKKILVDQDFYDETKYLYGSSAVEGYEVMPENARKGIIATAKEFIDSLGLDLGQIISELPASILNNISFGFDMLDILLKNVTEWFNNENNSEGKISEQLAEQVKDEEGKTSPLLVALVEFGKRIKELFMVTLPGFIKEAFIWIGSKASGIWDGLYAAFTGTEAETEIGVTISGFGLKIRKAIENLPQYIQAGLDWLKKNLFKKKEQPIDINELLVNNKPWIKKDIFGKNNKDKFNKEMTDEVEQLVYDFKDTSKLMTSQMDDDPFNFGEWVSELGTSLVNVFAELGPYILEGLNKVLEWIGKGLTWLTSAFNSKKEGEGIGDAVNRTLKDDAEASKFSGLIGALTKIGETIKNLITTIIPDFVTAGVKVLSEEIPKIMGGIGSIFGEPETEKEIENTVKKNSKTGLEQTGKDEMQFVTASVFNFASNPNMISLDGAKEANKESKFIKDAALDTVDNFSGILAGFKDLAKSDTGKTIALLVAVSFVLSKIKEVMHFGEDLKYAAKAAKWEAIKVAVYFIVGLLSYLTVLASTGSTDQLNQVYEMFKKFEGFADKLIKFVEVLASLKTANTALKTAGSIWGKAGGDSVNLVGIGAGAGYAGTKMAAGLAGVSIAGSIITESVQSWIGDLSTAFASLDVGFENLNKALGNLGEIKTKFGDLGDVISQISDFLISIRHLFEEKVTKEVAGETVEETENFKDEFAGIMATFTELNGVTANFVTAVSGKNIHAAEVVKAIEDLIDIRGKMAAFADFSITEDFERFKYAIASLGSALSMFNSSTAIDSETFSDSQIASLVGAVINIIQNEKLEEFAKDLDETGAALPDGQDIYRYAEKLVLIAGAISSIGEAAKGITRNTGKNIETLFETLSSMDFDIEVDPTTGISKVTKFASNFGVIGNAIGTFANEANKFTEENVKITEDAINLTVRLMSALSYYAQGTLDKVWSGDASIEQFGVNFNTFAEQMKAGLDKLAGVDVKYDQTALEQAMFAFRSIVVSYSQMNQQTELGKKIMAGTNFADVAKGLLGDDGLINALVSLLTTISSSSVPNISDEKYETITRCLHFISQLGDFAYQSHGVTFSTEMGDLKNGLSGDNNPFVVIFKALDDVAKLTEDNTYDSEKIFKAVDAFGSLMKGIALLATYTKGSYVNDAGKWYINDLIAQIGDLFTGLHAHFSDIQLFFDDVNTFDMGQITKAQNFFEGLNNLGSALSYFSDRKIFTGVENLEFFDWQGFMQKIKDAMAMEFDEEDDVFMPRIVPVLEISDEFTSKANLLRSMIGYEGISVGDSGDLNIPEASLNIADKIKIPDPINYEERLKDIYDKLESVNYNVSHFSSDLSNIKFIIYGDRLTETIGPSMDRYLGSEGVYVARVNGKD